MDILKDAPQGIGGKCLGDVQSLGDVDGIHAGAPELQD